jgi:succinate dehydrogenase/fumarate reductase-like Fe-S protein
MEDKFGYSVCLFTTVQHNGKFSHNVVEYKTVVAANETEARKMVTVEPARHVELSSGLVIDSEQWIHSVGCLGRAVRRMVTEFIKEDE